MTGSVAYNGGNGGAGGAGTTPGGAGNGGDMGSYVTIPEFDAVYVPLMAAFIVFFFVWKRTRRAGERPGRCES